MGEVEHYPDGTFCWVDLGTTEAPAAKKFYGGLFGWEFENRLPQDGDGAYFVAQLRGLDVAAVGGPARAGSPPVWNTYVAVDSADQAAARIERAGGRVVSAPADVLDAGRMGVFTDPAGATFSVWEARKHIGAQLVNELGSWNFSELNTRDTDEAARFYGEVFDWKIEGFEMGDVGYTIFHLAGYGDFLVNLNPELRKELAANGASGSFADAVAMLVRMTSDRYPDDAPAHWSITFAVEDADATAARAVELGGTVLVPPFDAEPVRMTVLADPQGATFAASKYQPTRRE
jgi:hypothetical protein